MKFEASKTRQLQQLRNGCISGYVKFLALRECAFSSSDKYREDDGLIRTLFK